MAQKAQKREMLRPDEPQTFADFCKWAARRAHEGLLEKGGPGLITAQWEILTYFSRWDEKIKP